MSWKNIISVIKNSQKVTFTKTKNKKVVKIDDIDVNKILISKEEPYRTKNSLKYLIRYNDHNIIWPLCVKLPQMTYYPRKFEYNSTTSFKISKK